MAKFPVKRFNTTPPKDFVDKRFGKVKARVLDSISRMGYSKSKMISFYEFYYSNQWDPSVKAKLEAEGRPALTFNYIKKPVDFLQGVISSTNMIPKALPNNSSAESVADVISALVHTIDSRDENQIAIEDAMLDALVTGVGLVKISPDFNDNPNGLISYKRVDPVYFYWDPKSEDKQFKDAKYVFEVMYKTREELIDLYPRKEAELREAQSQTYALGFEMAGGYLGIDYSRYFETGGKMAIPKEQPLAPDPDLFQVIRYQEYFYEDEQAIINNETGFIYNVPNHIDDAEIRKRVSDLNNKFGKGTFDITSVQKRKVRLIEFTGDIILTYIEDPYGSPYYDVAPIWCKKSGQYFQGVVEDLIDPQKEVNSKKSLMLEILSQAAINSFWIPAGAVNDEKTLKQLEKRLHKRNQLLEIRMDFGKPMPIVSDVSQKLGTILQLVLYSDRDISEISGMTDAIQGMVPKKIQSGRAIQRLQEWSTTIFKPIVKNYIIARGLIAKIALKQAPLVFAQERMIRIEKTDPHSTQDYEFMPINVETELGTINALQYDDYDIKIEITEGSPTELIERFAQMLRARELGIPIPDEYIIYYSNLPNKKELIRDIEQAKAQMAQQMQNQAPNQQTQQNPQVQQVQNNQKRGIV